MNTDRDQLSILSLAQRREKLNAFIETVCAGTAHTHDDDAFTVPTFHNVELHLWVTETGIEIRAKVYGVAVAPTAPRGRNLTLLERCAEVIVDGIASIPNPLMEQCPGWARPTVDRELARRAEYFASLAGTSKTLAIGDAIAVVEEDLQRRGKVPPEYIVPALMEAGLSCSWVKDRPPGQRSYAGHAPELRALQDAMHRAGAVPYLRLDYGIIRGQLHTIAIGGEVIATKNEGLLIALHGFFYEPSVRAFDVLRGALAKLTDPTQVVGAGPVAAWVRAQVQK